MRSPGKTRVLFIILGLAIGEPLGGAERFCVELVRHFDLTEIEPVVCGFWRYGAPSEAHWQQYLAERGIESFFAADWIPGRYLLQYYRGVRAVSAYLRAHPVAVIHSHFQMGTLAALWGRGGAVGSGRIVRTAHAGKEWGDGVAAFACRQIFTNLIFPLTVDVEVGVSQDRVAALDRRPGARLARRRARWIPNAVAVDRFTGSDPADAVVLRRELNLTPGDWVVGSVGRLRAEKGYGVLLQAAVRVKAAQVPVKFLIVGDGELRAALEAEAEALDVAGIVRFAGARKDVERFYRIMDLFVLSSFWEGLPTVILESMASGVPVVATDIPGTRELITDGTTGRLVRPHDPDDLAEKILEAWRFPERRVEWVARAMAEVLPRFGMGAIAAEYARLYRELL